LQRGYAHSSDSESELLEDEVAARNFAELNEDIPLRFFSEGVLLAESSLTRENGILSA
jgi:hypothetical protein